MKRLFFILMMVIYSSSFAASTKDFIQIFKQLNKEAKLHNTTLVISKDSSINAFAYCNKIGMNIGSLNKLNIQEIAFAVGHEIGHLKLNHFSLINGECVDNRTDAIIGEANADRYALKLMSATGFNACRGGVGFFNKMLKYYGDSGGDSHPSNSWRLQQVKKLAC